MSSAISLVLVVVPARDEEELLPRCLAALADCVRALASFAPSIGVETVVVVDRTTDGTGRVLAESPSVSSLTVELGNVGAARRAGVSHLLRNDVELRSVWIATTDADSIVPQDWLVDQIGLAMKGADLVLGGVVPEADGLSAAQREAWEEFNRLPDPTGDIHGANLGIRASAYVDLGGFEPRTSGEDVDLVTRAIAAGILPVRATGARVVTSSRVQARAPHGYSNWLHSGGLVPET